MVLNNKLRANVLHAEVVRTAVQVIRVKSVTINHCVVLQGFVYIHCCGSSGGSWGGTLICRQAEEELHPESCLEGCRTYEGSSTSSNAPVSI